MKLHTTIGAWLLCVAMLSGCTPATTDFSEEVNAVYLFKDANGGLYDWRSYGMPYRVNCITGTTAALCSDPLCMHDDAACPFYDCAGGVADGDIFFFRRGELQRDGGVYSGAESLYTYHVLTGETRLLATYADSVIFAGVYDNGFYYYLAEWAGEGENLTCTYSLCRADGRTGKVETLPLDKTYQTIGGFTANADYPNFYTASDGRLYWYTYTDDPAAPLRLFTTDPAGRNREELGTLRTLSGPFADGYAYSTGIRIEVDDDGAKDTQYILFRARFPDSEATELPLTRATTSLIASERYLYYLDGVDVDVSETSGGNLILKNPTLCRARLDGSAPEKIADLDGYAFLYRDFADDIFLAVKTDENGVDFVAMSFAVEADGRYTRSSDTLIVHTATGEMVVSQTDLTANHQTVVEYDPMW